MVFSFFLKFFELSNVHENTNDFVSTKWCSLTTKLIAEYFCVIYSDVGSHRTLKTGKKLHFFLHKINILQEFPKIFACGAFSSHLKDKTNFTGFAVTMIVNHNMSKAKNQLDRRNKRR